MNATQTLSMVLPAGRDAVVSHETETLGRLGSHVQILRNGRSEGCTHGEFALSKNDMNHLRGAPLAPRSFQRRLPFMPEGGRRKDAKDRNRRLGVDGLILPTMLRSTCPPRLTPLIFPLLKALPRGNHRAGACCPGPGR